MLAAGLLAKKAVERGLDVRSSVKNSLAPGSRVVTNTFKRQTAGVSGQLALIWWLRLYDLHRQFRPTRSPHRTGIE